MNSKQFDIIEHTVSQSNNVWDYSLEYRQRLCKELIKNKEVCFLLENPNTRDIVEEIDLAYQKKDIIWLWVIIDTIENEWLWKYARYKQLALNDILSVKK